MGFSLSDLDPFNPDNEMFDYAGTIPVVGPMVQGIGGSHAARNARDRAEQEAADRRAYYDSLGRDFRAVPDDPRTKARAEEIGSLRTREVDKGMYDATRSITGSYSKRGIGGSGYGVAAQSQAIQAAADERQRVRASALDQAVTEGQKGVMGQASVGRYGDPFLQQMVGSAEGQYEDALREAARQRDEYNKMLLQLIGQAAGGGFGGGMPGGAGSGMSMPKMVP